LLVLARRCHRSLNIIFLDFCLLNVNNFGRGLVEWVLDRLGLKLHSIFFSSALNLLNATFTFFGKRRLWAFRGCVLVTSSTQYEFDGNGVIGGRRRDLGSRLLRF
jgi:hypothetical protein